MKVEENPSAIEAAINVKMRHSLCLKRALLNEEFISLPDNAADPNWNVLNSWYQAKISANVTSDTGITMGTAPADDYAWDFQITSSARPYLTASCAYQRVS